MSLAPGDQLAIGMVDQYPQVTLFQNKALNQHLTVLVYKSPTLSLLGGNDREALLYSSFQSFLGNITLQLPIVVAVLVMRPFFPVSPLTPFSVFPGTTPK